MASRVNSGILFRGRSSLLSSFPLLGKRETWETTGKRGNSEISGKLAGKLGNKVWPQLRRYRRFCGIFYERAQTREGCGSATYLKIPGDWEGNLKRCHLNSRLALGDGGLFEDFAQNPKRVWYTRRAGKQDLKCGRSLSFFNHSDDFRILLHRASPAGAYHVVQC
jgi:hypothetical protein